MTMTSRRSWKKAEQKIAQALGGERTPLSGEMSRHTSGDAIGIPEYLEVKMQPENKAHEALSDLGKKARRQDRKPLIFYEHTKHNLTWAAMWFDHLLELRGDDEIFAVYNHLHDIDLTGTFSPYLIEHKVGASVTNGSLVKDTVQSANEEEESPIIVIQKKRSSNQLALVPFPEELDQREKI